MRECVGLRGRRARDGGARGVRFRGSGRRAHRRRHSGRRRARERCGERLRERCARAGARTESTRRAEGSSRLPEAFVGVALDGARRGADGSSSEGGFDEGRRGVDGSSGEGVGVDDAAGVSVRRTGIAYLRFLSWATSARTACRCSSARSALGRAWERSDFASSTSATYSSLAVNCTLKRCGPSRVAAGCSSRAGAGAGDADGGRSGTVASFRASAGSADGSSAGNSSSSDGGSQLAGRSCGWSSRTGQRAAITLAQLARGTRRRCSRPRGSMRLGTSGTGLSRRTSFRSSFLVRNLARARTSTRFASVRCGPSRSSPVRWSSPRSTASHNSGKRFTSRAAATRRYAASSDTRSS